MDKTKINTCSKIMACVGLMLIIIPMIPLFFMIQGINNLITYEKTKCQIINYDVKSYDCWYDVDHWQQHITCYSGGIVLNYTNYYMNITNIYIVFDVPKNNTVAPSKLNIDPDLILEKLEKKYPIGKILSCFYPNTLYGNINEIYLRKPIGPLVESIIIIIIAGLTILTGLGLVVGAIVYEYKKCNISNNQLTQW